MDDPIFEIRVRGFYTSKEADIAPSSTALIQKDGSGKMPDWDRLLEHLIKSVAEQIHGIPLKQVRVMTRDEAEQYRSEDEEAA